MSEPTHRGRIVLALGLVAVCAWVAVDLVPEWVPMGAEGAVQGQDRLDDRLVYEMRYSAGWLTHHYREHGGLPESMPLNQAAAGNGAVIELCPVQKRDLVSAQADGKGVNLKADIPDGLELRRADGSLLGHVFLNLLFNGLDASPRGGGLNLTAVGGAEEIRVEIRDSGDGFQADLPPERFLDPFFTTKAGGTGLGLYISRTIVERHGGEMQLSNHPDGGALVAVILPIETDPEMLPEGTDEPF